jgi:hypothetical protein
MNARAILRRLRELERQVAAVDRPIDYEPTRRKLEALAAEVLTTGTFVSGDLPPEEIERRRTSPAWAEIRRRLDEISRGMNGMNGSVDA